LGGHRATLENVSGWRGLRRRKDRKSLSDSLSKEKNLLSDKAIE